MPVLVPMSSEIFNHYLAQAILNYAENNTASGRWPAADAYRRSQVEHQKLLPLGLATPDNYLFQIHDAESQTPVGSLWLSIVERGGVRGAYVCDIAIDQAYRRQGHARRAFDALEQFSATLGLASVGLHVFAFNTAAQALYASLGYRVTGLNMQKTLGGDTPVA